MSQLLNRLSCVFLILNDNTTSTGMQALQIYPRSDRTLRNLELLSVCPSCLPVVLVTGVSAGDFIALTVETELGPNRDDAGTRCDVGGRIAGCRWNSIFYGEYESGSGVLASISNRSDRNTDSVLGSHMLVQECMDVFPNVLDGLFVDHPVLLEG
jgi:hypothetical protein